MKFTISYGLDPEQVLDEDYDHLVVGDDGAPMRQLTFGKPEVPSWYNIQQEICKVGPDVQISFWTIELEALSDVLELSRQLDCDITIERQPLEMIDGMGMNFPEFALVLG